MGQKEAEKRSPLPGICSGRFPRHCACVAAHTHSFVNTNRTNLILCAGTQPGAPAQLKMTRSVEGNWGRRSRLFLRRQQVQVVVIVTIMAIYSVLRGFWGGYWLGNSVRSLLGA